MRARLLAAAFCLAAGSGAGAQQLTPIQQHLKNFDSCVLMASIGIGGELHLVAERSFVACLTEEQAIRTFLALSYMEPSTIDAIVIRRKLDLKRIILNPKR